MQQEPEASTGHAPIHVIVGRFHALCKSKQRPRPSRVCAGFRAMLVSAPEGRVWQPQTPWRLGMAGCERALAGRIGRTRIAIPKAPLHYALRLPHGCPDILTHTHGSTRADREKAAAIVGSGCCRRRAKVKAAEQTLPAPEAAKRLASRCRRWYCVPFYQIAKEQKSNANR